MARTLRKAIIDRIKYLRRFTPEKLIARRLNRIMRYGDYATLTEAAADKLRADKLRADAVAAHEAAKEDARTEKAALRVKAAEAAKDAGKKAEEASGK